MVTGTILAKSKFYGNSTSAILDGVATLSLLARGEVRPGDEKCINQKQEKAALSDQAEMHSFALERSCN